jgi:glutathione synthase/RimK-type ligase-like ATP-grasp enzyme
MSALLWGIAEDSPLAAVRRELERLGTPVAFVDQRRAGETSMVLRTNGSVSGNITCGGTTTRLDDVASVYIRPYDGRKLPDPRGDAGALGDALITFAEIAGATVVNRPGAMTSNNSKPFQTALIAAAGFEVPETLVTTDPELVIPFWERHGAMIYKSVSGVRSIVSRFTPGHRDRLALVAHCPTQFQAYVPGTDVRIHVVGNDAFCCSIVSDGDDYRYAEGGGGIAHIEVYDPPDEIVQRAIGVTADLGLLVSGIDLRRTPDGRWYCFEANPSPGFTYYESATGLPIAAAIAALLSR